MPTTTIFRADGTVLVREWPAGVRPALKWLQSAVGGYIEMVTGVWHNEGHQVFVNEDAVALDLPPNLTAGKALGIVVGAAEGLLRGDVVRLEDFEPETAETRYDNPDDLGVPRMH